MTGRTLMDEELLQTVEEGFNCEPCTDGSFRRVSVMPL